VKVALSLMAATASADTGTAHIKIGSISGGESSITYWVDSSVASYGQNGGVDNAISKWDAASFGISFSSASSSTAKLKIYAGEYSLPANVYGETSYWYFNGQQIGAGAITNGQNYEVARVVIDAGWTSGWEQSERYMNAGHEIGHILGLNHFENAPAHSGDHWMKSGKYKLTSPTATDLAHVRTKWGW
jgi:hypothetical protein